MPDAARFNRRLGRFLAVVTVFAALPACSAGAVAPLVKEHGPLSPELRKLAAPSVRSKPPAGQAAALGLPASGPGSLVRAGGDVLVEVRFDGGALARLDDLRDADA